MNKILTAGLAILLLAACQGGEPVKLTIEGQFTNAAGKKIMLAMLPFGTTQRLVADSATLDSTGNFRLSTLQQQEGMCQLFVEDGPGILFINDTNHIIIKADAYKLGAYTVSNSQASQSLKSLYVKLDALQKEAAITTALADSIAAIPEKKMSDSLKAPYLAAKEKKQQAIAEFLSAYLGLEKNATATWYALGVASHFLTKEQWAAELKKAVPKHPQHPGLSIMKVSLAAAEQQENMGKHLLGKPVPGIALPDTSGNTVALNSFKGKWVLVDFWASWCGPCRAESPHLVAAYRQYKNKNFTVVGISLDDDKAAWTRAIQKDSLAWTQLSDLKKWDSEAVERYGFNAIPFNMLVDTAGIVVAVNLHGSALSDKLNEVVKTKKP